MTNMSKAKLCLAISALAIVIGAPSAYAADSSNDPIQALQAQIDALQKQLQEIKKTQAAEIASVKAEAATAKAEAASAKAATASSGGSSEKTGGVGEKVKVTVGGFVEAAAVDRSKNETTDIASNWNTALPFNNSINSHQSEFRGSARQSRITLLAEGKADDSTVLSAYGESDFLGAAPTANSLESNSYNPRLRVAYGAIDLTNSGWHFLAGQQWSLLTTNKVGIAPRQENIPLTIDAQYLPGFNWTRNPQVRVVKDFDDQKISLGLSLESPQTSIGGLYVPSSAGYNAGTSPLSTATYSTDLAPDVIIKAAFDPGYGHYEVFGLGRTFHDNTSATLMHNNDYFAASGGAAAILPVIPKWLDFQANVMAGQGIGRYGSVQLPDVAFDPNGGLKELTGYSGLVGLVGHPEKTLDTYLYAGYEGVDRYSTSNLSYGYGDYGFTNANCNIQGTTTSTTATSSTCSAQTEDVWQITAGVWDRLYEGNYGKVQIGLQDSITRRDAFSDSVGISPHVVENVVMTSFRFYPQ
jgi:hypothetical protein